MFSQQLNWVFYVTLAYGVVMIALAAYVILLLVQDSKITKSNPDEQK
jgi:heme exporter protein D